MCFFLFVFPLSLLRNYGRFGLDMYGIWGYSGHRMNHHSKCQGVARHDIESNRVNYCILCYQWMWILHSNIGIKVKRVNMIVLSNVHYTPCNLVSKPQDIRS